MPTFISSTGVFRFDSFEISPGMELQEFLRVNRCEGSLEEKPNARATYRTVWKLENGQYNILLHFVKGLLGGISLSPLISTGNDSQAEVIAKQVRKQEQLMLTWFSNKGPQRATWGQVRSGVDFKTGEAEILVFYG